eukprot:4983146-Amphidinium_carterae.1
MEFVLEALQEGSDTFETNPRQPKIGAWGEGWIGRADDEANSTLNVVFNKDLLVTSDSRTVRKLTLAYGRARMHGSSPRALDVAVVSEVREFLLHNDNMSNCRQTARRQTCEIASG